jgi:hypothetical protein
MKDMLICATVAICVSPLAGLMAAGALTGLVKLLEKAKQ